MIGIGEHIPVVKVLMVGIEPQEEGLEQFWVAEQNIQDILLVTDELLWRFAGDQLPNAEIEVRGQDLFDHDVELAGCGLGLALSMRHMEET